MTETFTGYITKYALTAGVREAILQEDDTPGMVRQVGAGYHVYYHGKDWHRTREDAIKRAEEMREAKIKSLRKSLAKLEALNFEAHNGK